MHRKPHLPEKPCAVCGRPFTWRRKWAKVWDEVRYCSDRCRRERNKAAHALDAHAEHAGASNSGS